VGHVQDSGKVVFGAPPGAEKVRYQRHYAAQLHVPTADDLAGTIDLALAQVGAGALRSGGERDVYAVELDPAELAELAAAHGEVRGTGGSERTYVEIRTVAQLLAGDEADWSTLGMILAVVR
jgi:hypothetical protein